MFRSLENRVGEVHGHENSDGQKPSKEICIMFGFAFGEQSGSFGALNA